MTVRQFLLRAAVLIFATLFITALLVRCTVRDSIPYLAVLHYATPLPLLVVNAVLVAICGLFLRRWRFALLWLLLATVGSFWSWAELVAGPGGTHDEGDLQVFFWNAGNGWLGWARVLETISQRSPDIVGLAEVGTMTPEMRAEWAQALPGYVMTDNGWGKMLMVRGSLVELDEGLLGSGGSYQLALVETSAGLLNVLLIDIHADPLRFRREPMESIVELVSGREGPIIVLGDFNLPADSVHFELLRGEYVNAFEHAGAGYSPTWPLPCPVLQLDHIWVNNALSVTEAEAGWQVVSDHRPVAAWIRLQPADDKAR